jgi:hypothetical protein
MIYSDAHAVVAANATESSLEKSAQLDGYSGPRTGGGLTAPLAPIETTTSSEQKPTAAAEIQNQ